MGPARTPLKPAPWRDGALVALAAVAVRVAHLALSHGDPTWAVPIIDAGTYRDLATQLARGVPPSASLVWQPVFYPLGLAAIFKVAGPSVFAARLVQIAIGGLTGLATWRLADRWFGRRVALTAGLFVALCGPLIFFEAQLEAAGPAALVTVLLVLLADTVGCTMRPWSAIRLGLAMAVAIYLRPTFLPAVAGLLVWLGWQSAGTARVRLLQVVLATATVLAVVVPVESVARARFGHGALLPASGSLNLFIGNNPDREHTVNVRPGLEWERLLAAPAQAGYGGGGAAGARYYRDRFWHYVRTAPAAYAVGLGRKFLQLVSTRELPRNQDIYLHRQWSPVLRVLVFRLGNWGFPGGVLLALGTFGLVLVGARRHLPALIVLSGVGAALVAVFVAARYRAPLWPLAAVFAAAGLSHAADLRHWRRDRRVVAALVAAIVMTVLGTVPGPFAQEQRDYRGELEFAVGHALYEQEDWQGAERRLQQAIALDAQQISARNFLAICLARLGRLDEAAAQWQDALALAPDYAEAARNLARVNEQRAEQAYRRGRDRETADPRAALADYRQAVALAPRWAEPLARVAWVEATSAAADVRDGNDALVRVQAALGLDADHPYLQLVLSAARAELGEWDLAKVAATRGLALATGDEAQWQDELRRALALYGHHQPWREPAPPHLTPRGSLR